MEGELMRREWFSDQLAWLQANVITPHVKGRVRKEQIFKPTERDVEDAFVKQDTEEMLMVRAEIRATETAQSLDRNASPQARQKRAEKLDRLYEELEALEAERDMEEEHPAAQVDPRMLPVE